MSQHALIFTPDGQGRGLFTEAINLENIGDLTIERASEVEFCNASGFWTVRLIGDHRILFRHPSRQACLDWERIHLEQLETQAHDRPIPPRTVATAAGLREHQHRDPAAIERP